jgi:hypothetical protein
MMRLQLMKLLMNRCAKSPEIRAIPSGLPAGTLEKNSRTLSDYPLFSAHNDSVVNCWRLREVDPDASEM